MKKLKLGFKEIAGRLTGFSIPIFGISWQPSESETQVAKRVIDFLEDRRVLYSPYELEIPHHCISSVFEIRRMLTEEMGKLSKQQALSDDLKLMRASCRKFLDLIQITRIDTSSHLRINSFDGWVFYSALGEFRGTLGIYISKIAASYGIDIEGDLINTLPGVDD